MPSLPGYVMHTLVWLKEGRNVPVLSRRESVEWDCRAGRCGREHGDEGGDSVVLVMAFLGNRTAKAG